MSKTFHCSYCSLTFQDTKSFITHYRIIHSLFESSNLNLSCVGKGCPLVFKTFNGFKKHLKKCPLITESEPGSHEIPTPPPPPDQLPGTSLPIENTSLSDIDTTQIEENTDQKIKSIVSSYLTNLNSLGIPNNKIQTIVNTTSELFVHCSEHLQTFVKENCLSLACSDEEVLLHELDKIKNTFKGMETQYKRNKQLFKGKAMVSPKPISIGIRIDKQWDKDLNLYKEVPKTNTFMYVPIIETLNSILNNKSVQEWFLNPELGPNHPNNLYSFRDGITYKTNQLFLQHPNAIQLQLFYDDFETVNPLGSKTAVHKLGGIYFTLRNLPLHLNSLLENIHLVALFHVADVKEVGINEVLKPIIHDIKKLETEGIVVDFLSDAKCLFGTVVSISCDNLGANTICGFVESFSATNFCRICLSDKETCQHVFDDSGVNFRNSEMHQEDVRTITENPQLGNVHGVKTHSVLNYLNFFNIFDNLTVDIMHDILEGVVELEVKLFFKSLVLEEKVITLESLNNRIRTFNYGMLESKNCPGTISLDKPGNSLGQKAIQTWCLMRFLPLIIGDIVQPNDIVFSKWQVLLLLLDIMDIVFAPKCSTNMITILRQLIEEHHSSFKRVFGHRLIPKHHFMTHYPTILRLMGPLSHLWAMRYEAKHAYFTQLAPTLKCYKNICLTLATRHQQFMAHKWTNKNVLEQPQTVGKSKFVTVGNVLYSDIIVNHLGLELKDQIVSVDWIKIGFFYKKQFMLCVGIDDFDLPIFHRIQFIFLFNETTYFVTQVWNTCNFDLNSHSYIVKQTNQISVLKADDLFMLEPLELHQPYHETTWHVVPKYVVM